MGWVTMNLMTRVTWNPPEVETEACFFGDWRCGTNGYLCADCWADGECDDRDDID